MNTRKRILTVCCLLLWAVSFLAQNVVTYIMHSSGLFLANDPSNNRGTIYEGKNGNVKALQLINNDDGTFCIACPLGNTLSYLTLDGSWNTSFLEDPTTSRAHFTMETSGGRVKFRCKYNGKYLGTDASTSGSRVYSDKDGNNTLHLWYLADSPDAELPVDTLDYLISPAHLLQRNEGWGVSLCWWANMCGKWSDEKIDEIIDWLVSPTGLNYNIFRYNIGGGDDPQNRNCTAHHMGSGKGLRAEMEGFKDYSLDEYHWDRDAAQRKIMLKIREKRPDAIFEAFSNSAPYYMTYSGCVAGAKNAGDDNLRPEYYEEFAHYLVDVCKHYYDEYGIVFKTLEPFNEPNTNYWGANGSQEGCHFGFSSQVAFLRVLAPILQESGLPTIISASDETNVATSVSGFNAYESAGVLDLVGQWNTHTYSASTKDRAQVGVLARSKGKLLWQSETGSGGTGLAGNLALMQRAIDDIRYILPDAWLDWQYVEEAGDQWCTVRGNFSSQTYERVRSYYVHQQLTRFIPVGYHYVASLNPNTLAALSPEADTLVLVAINAQSMPVYHRPQLLFAHIGDGIEAWRTSETENLAQVSDVVQTDAIGQKGFLLPAQSITTLLIPLYDAEKLNADVEPDVPYLIQPQYNVTTALTAGANGQFTIEDIDLGAAQVWYFRKQDGGYVLQNADGRYLNDGGSSYAMQVVDDASEATVVNVIGIDNYFCRIMTDATKGFDLNGEAYAAGTQVGHYAYGNSPGAGHRNWQLLRLSGDKENGIERVVDAGSNIGKDGNDAIYDLTGRRVARPDRPGIYIIRNKKFLINY